MKVWKLVSGIISIVLFIFVVFQSCAAGLGNALAENGETSGTSGVFLAIFMLAGGIVAIASREKNGKGANIALLILYLLAALIGFVGAGSYSDLRIWAGWCTICAVLGVVALFKGPNE